MVVTDTLEATEPLDEVFLAARRRDLLARLASYREQLEGLSATAAELAFDPGLRDGGDEEGFGEGDPLGVERDRVLALAGRARTGIEQIEAALTRLDAGSYGVCERCDRLIPADRLEALPETSRCLSCKSGSVRQLP